MSLDATRWAWQQAASPTRKLVLLSLSDRAGEDHTCHPSIPRLAADTGLDRKTIMQAIFDLENDGLIIATRAIGTVTTYALIGVQDRHKPVPKPAPVPKTAPVPKEGPHQYQKRDRTSTKNGTLNLSRTYQEPLKEEAHEKETSHAPEKKSKPKLDTSPLPPDLSPELWEDFVKHRRAIKAPVSTNTIIKAIARELEKAQTHGITPDQAIEETIAAGWRGVKADWIVNRIGGTNNAATTANHAGTRKLSGAERATAAEERIARYYAEPANAE